MKGRKVYRDNTIVYPDLYYVWTYMPPEICKTFFRHNKRLMYRKHICGIGYYSRYHARHIISLMLYDKAMDYCHIVKGSKLIKEGITTLPKKYNDRVYINDPFTKDGSRKLRRWIYPPEFKYDKHRRRHFIVYLVRSAEDKGVYAFNKKYKRYFNGYREPSSVKNYIYKKKRIFNQFLREYRIKKGLPENGITYDNGLLKEWAKRRKEEKQPILRKSSSSIIK